MSSPTDYARAWLPKTPSRLVPILIGAGLFTWVLLSLAGPPGPPPPLPGHGRPWRDHHDPRLGFDPPIPTRLRPYPPPRPDAPTSIWSTRADKVREAFLHAYAGYKRYAPDHDELLPLTNKGVNNFNGWRVTLLDALDTMWIMGLRKEFDETIPIVANMTFHLPEGEYAPFFETVIRYLGGLLSAYALSGEPTLLSRADDLGRMLLPAFNTTHGLPMYAVNTVTGDTRMGWTMSDVLWSEMLSCQLEYKYLAHLTGRREYFDHVEHIMDLMKAAHVTDGMFPTRWQMLTAEPSNSQFSVGAFADSAHEYLLKQWLMTSKYETHAKDLYLEAVNGILKHLLYLTPNRHLLYVTDTQGTQASPSYDFEHLSCFLPGLLALGAHTLPLSAEDRQLHEWAAEGLGYTCWMTYADHETGLGPDVMIMDSWLYDPDGFKGRWLDHVKAWKKKGSMGIPPGLQEGPTKPIGLREYTAKQTGYLLRPETVESFYILWRTTGDAKWRERGWAVFEAIERESKTPSGYASVTSVESSPAPKKDEMPSFFMAETLKYLYLLFSDEELIPLDQWVFNTEAHPLPVFEWAPWEKERYSVRH